MKLLCNDIYYAFIGTAINVFSAIIEIYMALNLLETSISKLEVSWVYGKETFVQWVHRPFLVAYMALSMDLV